MLNMSTAVINSNVRDFAERHNGNGDQRAGQCDDRRNDEERAFGGERYKFFFEEKLDAIRERL